MKHKLHIFVIRSNYNFRILSYVLDNTGLNKGASHNRNILTRAGKTKVRFKLGIKKSIKKLCSAVNRNSGQNVLVDGLVIDSRSVRINVLTNLRKQCRHLSLTVDSNLLTKMVIVCSARFRTCIGEDEGTDNLFEIFNINLVLIFQKIIIYN